VAQHRESAAQEMKAEKEIPRVDTPSPPAISKLSSDVHHNNF
jgi:hypothetical protein